MKSRSLSWGVVISLLVLVIVVVLLYIEFDREDLIGGERDEFGCLGAAGYSWDEDIGACIRDWELNEGQRAAAGIVVDFLGRDKLTVTEVMVARCPGCYWVEVVDSDYRMFQVILSDWVVSIGSFAECVLAGFPVMESYPRQCSDGNESWTEIFGSKECVVDSDCVVFGQDGDCNCGCYDKDDLPMGTGGDCFCAAPESCECVDDVCFGVY